MQQAGYSSNSKKKDVADFYPDEDWHILAQNREGWKQLCLNVCSKRP